MKIFIVLFWCYVSKIFPIFCNFNLNEKKIGSSRTRHNLNEELNFVQRRDHFDHIDREVFNQTYYLNDEFYREGGPVFLLIGAREAINNVWMSHGDWIDYAKKFGAVCFYLEHRFYGESRPFSNTTTDNLRYLTSEQAIADIGWFIKKMNIKYKNIWTNPKWVTFGGSYAGSLSAWARMKYPHLIHAAVSTSGSFNARTEFEDYYKEVEKLLILENHECANQIKLATKNIEEYLKTKTKYIEEIFQLCQPINTSDPLDKANLYSSLAINVGLIALFNNVNKFFQNPSQKRITIKQICEVMTDYKKDAVERYAEVNKNMLNLNHQNCLEAKYSELLEIYRNTTYNEFYNYRLWLYQTCTEFGSWSTSKWDTHIFGEFDKTYYFQLCEDTFGKNYNEKMVKFCTFKSNEQYGELATRQGRIVYVHGSADPVHPLGVTEQKIVNTRSVFINGTAHCANMFPPTDNDPIQLIEARREIGNILEEWLRESDTVEKN